MKIKAPKMFPLEFLLSYFQKANKIPKTKHQTKIFTNPKSNAILNSEEWSLKKMETNISKHFQWYKGSQMIRNYNKKRMSATCLDY